MAQREYNERVFTRVAKQCRPRDERRFATKDAATKVLDPKDNFVKFNTDGSVQSVAKLMKEKHPPAAPLAQRHMAEFEGWLAEGGEGLPPLTPPTFEASDVEAAVVKLHGGAGLSGVTAHSLVRMLTVHGQASFAFRKAVARYTTVRGAILIDWVKLRARSR